MTSGKPDRISGSNAEVLAYIPQRPPFVFIDKLLEASENKIVASFEVKPDNLLVSDGRLTEGGIIEAMAQTIAAGAGFKAIASETEVKIGYIAAIRNLQIFQMPEIGASLTVSVMLVNQVLDITIAETEVLIGTEKVASCEMRIFIKND
ncbi:MAG: 3-hydroxyacyl-ACP dehydratase [Bacteroidetes bacterium]|nr:3-hydroxyacyl-ACP dehydratase [Bacteroidota bacterium]